MFRLFYFKNLYLLPIVCTLLFYCIPSILAILFNGNSLAPDLLLISLLSIFSYFVSYKLLCVSGFSSLFLSAKKFRISWEFLSLFIVIVYFLIIVYASITSPGLALVEAIKGATISDLSELREEFLRTRVGWEKILLYIYTICISALIPLVITYMFLFKRRGRFFIFGLFLYSLLLMLEKGRALVCFLPLIVLYVNIKKYTKAYKVVFYLLITISVVSFVARGGLVSLSNADKPDPMAGVADKYNLFKGQTDQFHYLINRVGYIPYITAIDWLEYKKEILNRKLLYGRSISFLATITGQKKINLEREVFAYQWGQNYTNTGSANTAFYIDAYLNFGVIGIIIYSFLMAFVIQVCILSNNKPLIYCLPITLYYVCFHSLTAVLLSGGLGFLFIIAVFFKISVKTGKHQTM